MEKIFIPVLLGTAREGRESEKVARWLVSMLEKQDGVRTELVDVRDMGYSATVPPWGTGGANEKPTKWKEVVLQMDGLLIVVPEYNRGYPGELKMVLDSLFDEYAHRPVTLCGVSSGGFGGARGVENIQPVLTDMKMVVVQPFLHVLNVADTFDDDGPKDREGMEGRAQKTIDLLKKYAEALRPLRA